jgi:predicted transcriptional regulator
MGDTTTIRISKEVYDTVKSIAQQKQGKIQDVVEQAVKDYKKKVFFDSLNSAYASLKADSQSWEEEVAERAEWDVTLKDGLENEDGN